MIRPDIAARRIGTEGQPVAIVDGFHPDPDGLRGAAAAAAAFAPAGRHYPGLRAPLPADYFAQVRPALTTVLRELYGATRGPALIDASFSIVTTTPDALTVQQRIPHIDAVEPTRIALVHYLTLTDQGGTAFYRHRATGFETIDPGRRGAYLDRLRHDLAAAPAPAGYMTDGGDLFERTALIEARFNRAVIYRSAMLHSGAIPPGATLAADPATGRLTVTAFLSLG